MYGFGFFLYDILDKFTDILLFKNMNSEITKYNEIKENLKKALNTNGWDGRWFKRAFTDNGETIGTMEGDECKIDNIAQSWSVISGAGDNDKKYISLESLETHLIDKENGLIKLLDPPFLNTKINPGYIKSYPPGVRENGGQYTHAAAWAIIAFCMLGFGDKAVEYFKMITPIEHSKTKDTAKKYKVEPYVVAGDVYSKDSLQGRGGWTWYTGSSSWLYKACIEYILGLKIEKGILKIEPCIPKDWPKYEIQYKYINSVYNITVKNSNGKNTGVQKILVNGNIINSPILLKDTGTFNIEILM